MKKTYRAVLAALLMLLLAAGCGSSSSDSGYEETEDVTMANYAATDAVMEESVEEYETESASGAEISSENGIGDVSDTGRKLIRTVNLDVETRDFDTMLESVSAKVEELGGYIESSSIYGNNYSYETTRSANYTVRIPSDQLDAFVTVVGELGNVTYKNESVEDVTLQYVDTESRKTALETEQTRLLELLEQAENMEDLLAIESKLSEVRYELENYGSQLRVLDNQIDYSTVYVNISEVERITETKERTFFEEISDRFSDSLYIVTRGFRSFVIGFIGSLPILLVWAAILAVFILGIRKILYKKKDGAPRKKKGKNPPEDPKPQDPSDFPEA